LLGLGQSGPAGLVHISHQNVFHVEPPLSDIGGNIVPLLQ
jgi:hypothetical protein